MKLIKCDRCSDEFEEPCDDKISTIQVRHRLKASNDVSNDIEADICNSCYRTIKDFIIRKLAQAELK